jgi:hypothetical protein
MPALDSVALIFRSTICDRESGPISHAQIVPSEAKGSPSHWLGAGRESARAATISA